MPAERAIPFLLFGSGFCALVYQVVWEREFRLVFGASTIASAAVIAIFIGGLGAGALVIGRRVDRHPSPLRLFGQLEAGVALSSALSPVLLRVVRGAYVALGGSGRLGDFAGTVVRLVLVVFVLAVPTILLGGSLPAAARAAEQEHDEARRKFGVLYGVNTLGAVLGTLVTTFLLLEVFGNRVTLWLAALIELLVAVIAIGAGRRIEARTRAKPAPEVATPADIVAVTSAPRALVLVAAAAVGFAFILMELVFQRMLTPLLGGTVFTFGLVLALVLAGIALGGVAYGTVGVAREPTLRRFAVVCALEGVAIAVPYALGDRIVLFALRVSPLRHFGLTGYLIEALLVAGIIVLPAALVAGFQFPLLVGLRGRGVPHIGVDVGEVYACNTIGAIAGAVAGGFGLLPALSATGCWRLSVGLLAAVGVAYAIVSVAVERRPAGAALAIALAGVGVTLCRATGPTSLWRDSGLALATQSLGEWRGSERVHELRNAVRRRIVFAADGRESSVAVMAANELTLVVGGSVDAASRSDAESQVGAGILLALFQPAPRRALVLGMGTGGTPGWLGQLDSMERVDVVEPEPASLEMARRCAPLNRDVLANPKVRVSSADGRERLLTTRDTFDIVVAEPSTPYRAGVANLYTREMYEAVAARLAPNGLFGQWLQAELIDADTARTILATLASVFPYTELWELGPNDLFVLAAPARLAWNVTALRHRLATEPFRSGFRQAWRATELEDVAAHFRAANPFVRAIARIARDRINTDDQNFLEFSFARTLGDVALFGVEDVKEGAFRLDVARPRVPIDALDWSRVEDEVASAAAIDKVGVVAMQASGAAVRARTAAKEAYAVGHFKEAIRRWRLQDGEPRSSTELLLLADAMTETRDDGAGKYIDALAGLAPLEAVYLRARALGLAGQDAPCAAALADLFVGLRGDPWPERDLMRRALVLARDFAISHPALARDLIEAISRPFAAGLLEELRRDVYADLLFRVVSSQCREAYRAFEPFPRWETDFLEKRWRCYAATHDPLERAARLDAKRIAEEQPLPFRAGVY